MPTIQIELLVARDNNITRLTLADGRTSVVAGTIDDNHACELIFTASASYNDAMLKLMFENNFVVIPINRRFSLPRSLTQQLTMNMQCAFVRNGVELEHSNRFRLLFRDGVSELEPPDPLPNQEIALLYDLAARAITDVALDPVTEEPVFTDFGGAEKGRLPALNGHDIINPSGATMTKRHRLQFVGVDVMDNEPADTIVVRAYRGSKEDISDQVDGATSTFTLPYRPEHLFDVRLNGKVLEEGHQYTYDGDVTFMIEPEVVTLLGDTMVVVYW